MQRAAAALTAFGWVALATPARADSVTPVHIVAGVAGEKAGALATILIGSSGQLYLPDAEATTWKRQTPGGVAVTVHGALRGPTGAIVVAGDATPPFRYSNEAWQAAPLSNRGSLVVAGAGSTAAVAVGRHIYLARGTRWVRTGAARRSVQVLWAASPSRIYIVDDNGALLTRTAHGFVPVATNLPPDDHVVAIAGNRELYALTLDGTLLRITGTRATTVKRDPELAALAPELLALDPAGGVLVAGTLPGPPARRLLARAKAGQLHKLSELPAPTLLPPPAPTPAPTPTPTPSSSPLALSGAQTQSGQSRRAAPTFDPVVVLRADRAGAILAATRRGTVIVRHDASSPWTETHVSGDLPPDTAHRVPHTGPAHAH